MTDLEASVRFSGACSQHLLSFRGICHHSSQIEESIGCHAHAEVEEGEKLRGRGLEVEEIRGRG